MGVNDQKPPDRSRHLQGKFLWSLDRTPPIRSHRTFKTYPYQIGTQRKRSCVKQINKISIYFYFVLFSRTTPLPQLGLWTFEPAFSPRVSFPLSPRSFFHTRQRFPLSNHVTSGSHEPAILFCPLVSGFPHRK